MSWIPAPVQHFIDVVLIEGVGAAREVIDDAEYEINDAEDGTVIEVEETDGHGRDEYIQHHEDAVHPVSVEVNRIYSSLSWKIKTKLMSPEKNPIGQADS